MSTFAPYLFINGMLQLARRSCVPVLFLDTECNPQLKGSQIVAALLLKSIFRSSPRHTLLSINLRAFDQVSFMSECAHLSLFYKISDYNLTRLIWHSKTEAIFMCHCQHSTRHINTITTAGFLCSN